MWNIFCILSLLTFSTTSLHLHQFYALQKTNEVSASQSIQLLNNCKKECLQMGNYFSYQFKYHRYVLREERGSSKYFEGTCLFAQKNKQDWKSWEQLGKTIGYQNQEKVKKWQKFNKKCEDKSLKLSKQVLKSLGYKRVHSNFEYYDNGKFVNLSPFKDINKMMRDVFGHGGV